MEYCRSKDKSRMSFSIKTPESTEWHKSTFSAYGFSFSSVRTCCLLTVSCVVCSKFHSLTLNELLGHLIKKQCKRGMCSLAHNEHSCLATSFLCTATAYFLLNRGCPASCAYYTKPMTTDSPNSTVALLVSKRYLTVTDCKMFRSLADPRVVAGYNSSYCLSLLLSVLL